MVYHKGHFKVLNFLRFIYSVFYVTLSKCEIEDLSNNVISWSITLITITI